MSDRPSDIYINVTISDPLKQNDSFGSYMMYVRHIAPVMFCSDVYLTDTGLIQPLITPTFPFQNFLY